jgi:gluconolactonase
MFAAPPIIETQIFATLPDELRIRDRSNDITQFVGWGFDSFLEGPSFDMQGNLYCVDVFFGRIFCVSPAGEFSVVVEYDGEPNGLKIHRDGRLFVADRRRGIVVVDPAERRVQHMVDRFDLEPFRGPNDLVFAPDGDLYFTDQGMSDVANPTGRVFRLCADGRLQLVLDKLPGPNGIALDPSGRVLYVAMTRANSIVKATLLPNGRPWRVQNFIQLSGGGGPDGIAVDSEGGIAVAHPQMGAVWIFDARGQPTLRINLCQGLLGTNVAYGGPDGRRLYITESQTGTIQVADLPMGGIAMFSHLVQG